jgi:hypothetical protein
MDEMMDIQLRYYDKIIQLINKSVVIPNPFTIDLGEEDSERG